MKAIFNYVYTYLSTTVYDNSRFVRHWSYSCSICIEVAPPLFLEAHIPRGTSRDLPTRHFLFLWTNPYVFSLKAWPMWQVNYHNGNVPTSVRLVFQITWWFFGIASFCSFPWNAVFFVSHWKDTWHLAILIRIRKAADFARQRKIAHVICIIYWLLLYIFNLEK